MNWACEALISVQRPKHKIVIQVPIQMCIYSSLLNTMKSSQQRAFLFMCGCIPALHFILKAALSNIYPIIGVFYNTHSFTSRYNILDTISTLEYQYHDIPSKKPKFALSDSSIPKQIPATLFQISMEYWYISDTWRQAFSSILGNYCKFTVSADAASAAHLPAPVQCSSDSPRLCPGHNPAPLTRGWQ